MRRCARSRGASGSWGSSWVSCLAQPRDAAQGRNARSGWIALGTSRRDIRNRGSVRFRHMRKRGLFAATCAIVLASCAGAHLASKPGVYAVSVQPAHTTRRDIHATYVRPVQARHPGYLIVFATGDDGWFGTSGALFEHLADEGYTIAGVSAPEVLRPIASS